MKDAPNCLSFNPAWTQLPQIIIIVTVITIIIVIVVVVVVIIIIIIIIIAFKGANRDFLFKQSPHCAANRL